MGALYRHAHLFFLQEIKRANCICSSWNSATDLNLQVFPPERNGWKIEKNEVGQERFSFNWFEGDMAPQRLEDVLQKETPSESEFLEDECDDDSDFNEEDSSSSKEEN